jgi:hypothetical protein
MSTDYQEIIDTLREKNGVSSTVAVGDRNYVVTTTIKKSKYGWYYETTAIPNDRKTTALEDGRWQAPVYDSEEKWSAFLQEAAKQYLDKCARIAGDSEAGTAGRKNLLIAAALAGIVLVAGVVYFYFNPPGPPAEPAQPAASVRTEEPPISTSPPAPTPAKPLPPPPPSQGSISPPVTPQVPPPALDPGKIEAIITAPAAGPPPLSVPPAHSQSQGSPPKSKTKEDKAKEDKIRCMLSPQDCQ